MSGEVEVQEDLVDVEAYAKAGRPVPHAKRYRIRINKQHYVVDRPVMTGREILELAGMTPAEQFLLRLKLHGGGAKKIEPDQSVDFRAPGVERFVAQKREVQDGA
jgi:hypothetical protein